jgi:hypothetical protein
MGHKRTKAAKNQKQERDQRAFGGQLPTFRRDAELRTTAIK